MTWEYLIVDVASGDKHTVRSILNQYGSVGWELVSITPSVAYFKRPLP